MGIWDDFIGNTSADASKKAAQDTYLKQMDAGRGIRDAGDRYQGDMRGIGEAYDPYVQSGNSALARLMQGLGLPGGDGSDFTAAYRNLPGYESGLETGTNAALRQVNASGMGNSGRALKSLQRFGSDYEDTRVGDYLTRLMGLGGQGLQATGAQADVYGRGASGRLGAYTQAGQGDYGAAGTIGEGDIAAAQAKQQGWQNLFNTGAKLAGTVAGAAIGGPAGASIGSNLFSAGSKATGGRGSFIGTGNEWWK